MARTCTICAHSQRAEIELSVTNGTAYRTIAKQYAVGYVSVQRHIAEHIKQAAKQLQSDRDEAKTLDVLAQLHELNVRTWRIYRASLGNAKTYGLALQAGDRIKQQIELSAKLSGDLDERPIIDIWATPEWLQMQNTIMMVLKDEPAIRVRLADALEQLEESKDGV